MEKIAVVLFVHSHVAPNLHKSMITRCTENHHRLCAYLTNDYLFASSSPCMRKFHIKFIVPPVHLTHFHLFRPVCCEPCVDLVVSSFFFGFVVALVLCVKPAPEQQRLDDAIGYLREHAEVRNAEFQFFSSSPLFYSFTFFHLLLTHVVFTPRSRIRYKNMFIALFAGLRFPSIMITYCAHVVHNL